MSLEEKVTIKGIETLRKCMLRLLPFASISIIDKLQNDFNEHLNSYSNTKLQNNPMNQTYNVYTTVQQSIYQVLESLKKLKTSIRIKSISYPDRQKLDRSYRNVEPEKITQHPSINNQFIKHLPLMSMKWKQVNEDKVSRQIVPNANVDSDSVALLATTIPKLQLSIDRINESRWTKRQKQKSSTQRKHFLQSQRVHYESQKQKRYKQQKQMERNQQQQEEKDKIFLKSHRVNRVPRGYKIQRLF